MGVPGYVSRNEALGLFQTQQDYYATNALFYTTIPSLAESAENQPTFIAPSMRSEPMDKTSGLPPQNYPSMDVACVRLVRISESMGEVTLKSHFAWLARGAANKAIAAQWGVEAAIQNIFELDIDEVARGQK